MNTFTRWPRGPVLGCTLSAALLSGCASFTADGGFGAVSGWTRERTGQSAQWQRTTADIAHTQALVHERLRAPLSADSSAEIALLNNPGLQARFAELGVAEADRVRAGRLPNPRLGLTHLRGGGDTEIDRSVSVGLLELLSLPMASALARERFERAQMEAAAQAVALAGQARRAFFEAVAAEQLAQYQAQVHETADIASELAQRMQRAGNLSQLDRWREQAFAAQTASDLLQARHKALAARERLGRVLGWSGPPSALILPERLPDLSAQPYQSQAVEQTALDRRLDVALARRRVEATARSLGLTRATRMVNALELGYANKSGTGQARQDGYEVTLELPLFDFGATRTARAQAVYMQSLHEAGEVATNARSQARQAYAAYRASHELARHYRDDVIPLRQRISQENLLRYNGMLIGVFELLADAREQIASVTAGIEALQAYWLADTDLRAALAMPPDRVASPAAAPGTPPGATSGATSGAASGATSSTSPTPLESHTHPGQP